MAELGDLSVQIHWPGVENSTLTVLGAAFEEGRYPGAELVEAKPPPPARRKRSRSTKDKGQAEAATNEEN